MVHASSSLIAVMGVWIALMAVMRLDAVGVTYCGYLGVAILDIINLRASCYCHNTKVAAVQITFFNSNQHTNYHQIIARVSE